MTWNYLGIGILCFVGSAITLFVVKSVIETLVFTRAANRTVGKVIRLATARNSDNHLMYLPVFEYQTNDGAVYQYTSTIASTPPAYEIGETVTLLYLRKNPQNAKIKSFSELWLVKIVLAVIGLACFGGAAVIFFASR
jgi:ABC-type transport system involved in multi-copper enzyme maturation permease subunit